MMFSTTAGKHELNLQHLRVLLETQKCGQQTYSLTHLFTPWCRIFFENL